QWSPSVHTNIVLILNNQTLIHSNVIQHIHQNYTNLHAFYGQNSCKVFYQSNLYTLTERRDPLSLLDNWFCIHRTILDKLRWNIFNSQLSLHDIIMMCRKKFNAKTILVPSNGTVYVM